MEIMTRKAKQQPYHHSVT